MRALSSGLFQTPPPCISAKVQRYREQNTRSSSSSFPFLPPLLWPSPHLAPSQSRVLLLILILNPPPTLTIPKAAPGARAPFASKIALLLVPRVLLLPAAAYAEEHGGDEPGEEGRPGETVCVRAEACGLAVFAEDGAGLDGPGAMLSVSTKIGEGIGGGW